jgi:sulfur-oxidizing protein SoxZ
LSEVGIMTGQRSSRRTFVTSAAALATSVRHSTIGVPIPRNIVTSFVATYNDEEIFRAELFPAIAANPFITFFTVATESGTIAFNWTGDNGFDETASAKITVE